MDGNTLDAWKAQARAGTADPEALLEKNYLPDLIKASEDDERSLTFTITTGAIDRENDTIAVDGWDVEAYMRNPVVLWAHNSRELPIGKCTSVVKEASALKATARFAEAEKNPRAEQVFRLLQDGYLRATSVGFRPKGGQGIGWAWDEQRGGINFLKQELLEFSIVPIPANPECLMAAKRAGKDFRVMRELLIQTIDEISDEPVLLLPRSKAEQLLALLEAKTVVPVVAPPAPAPSPEPAGDVVRLTDLQLLSLPITPEELGAAVKKCVDAAVAAEIRRHTGRLED